MEFTPSVTIELAEYKRLERVESTYKKMIGRMRSSIKTESTREGYEIEIDANIILEFIKCEILYDINDEFINKIEFVKK